MSSDEQLMMAGLPASGKTTFLALLSLALFNGRTSKIKLAHYQDDRDFLNMIARRLERCEKAVHTEVGEDRQFALSLLIGERQEEATLRIPDLSGETWKDASLSRHWPETVDALASASSGLVLLVHTRGLDGSAEIGLVDEVVERSGFLDDASATTTPPPETDVAEPAADSANMANAARHKPPPQVQVVDFLQLISEQRGSRPAYVSIVFSAWDKVDPGTAPSVFLERNMPLVAQYLSTNAEWLKFRCFGLSAQGGDFETAKDALLEEDPVARAIVKDPEGSNAAVEDIVLWALGDHK